VLTPGLNPRLEQKAIMLQDYLFDLVSVVVDVLAPRFTSVKVVCAYGLMSD
jgi:hypothetical protein